MISVTRSFAVALAMVGAALMVSASASADPLLPLKPAEVQYLDHLRQVFSLTRDRAAFRGDGELLELGYYVCTQKAAGLVGSPANLVSPIINQVALNDLCPN